jgi:hypothetical protein
LNQSQTKIKSRRLASEFARRAALEGHWEEAISLNRTLIERDPRDTEAYNRLGRALLEYKDFSAAYEVYSGALRSDPANLIARRNLQRLELLRQRKDNGNGDASETAGSIFPRTMVFIEEVGKTWVDELVNPAPMGQLAEVYAGQQLQLQLEDGRLIVVRSDGSRVGEIEAKTAERVIELMNGGNVYEVYALGLSSVSLRVILREVQRSPEMAGRVSFPRQIAATRAYLRERDNLRLRDEADFLLEDEDMEDDEIAQEASEPDNDDSSEGDSDSDDFIAPRLGVDEEDVNR